MIPGVWCSECKNTKQKAFTRKYKENNEGAQELSALRESKSREKKKAYIFEHYRKSCAKCDEKRGYLLEFHHLDRATKQFDPLNNYQFGLERIIAEIEKCVVLCANCHKEFHHFERKLKISTEQYLKGDFDDN